MSLLDQWRNKYKELLTNTIPQKLGQIASNPTLNNTAQGIQNIPQTVGRGIVGAAEGLTRAPIIGQIGYQIPRSYGVNQIARPLVQGGLALNKPGIINKGMGLMNVGQAMFNATPGGVGFNALTGLMAGGARSVRTGQNLASSVQQGFTQPTSFAQEGLGVKNPLLALGIDIATANGNPKQSLNSIKSIAKLGKNFTKSNFSLDKQTMDEVVSAEDMIKNPEGWVGKLNLGKSLTKKEAIKKIQAYGAETVDRLSARYLPDKQLNNLKTAEAKIKALVDLSKQNKLANVEGGGMGFVGKKSAQPPLSDTNLLNEAKKYSNADEFFLYSKKGREALREQGIKSQEAIKDWFNENATPKNVLDTLNPTGTVNKEYSPQARATMKLGENITTLDKTMGKSPNNTITIYRGVPKGVKKINPGDFITVDPELAKTYTGDDNVVSMKVKLSDILDDVTEPLGGEYIYRPSKNVVQGGLVSGTKQPPLSDIPKEYKPTEEILSKPLTIHHGAPNENIASIKKNGLQIEPEGRPNITTGGNYGVSFTTSKDVAQKYADQYGGGVFSTTLPKGTKVLKIDTQGYGVDQLSYNELQNLKNKGYGAVIDVSEGQEAEVRLLSDFTKNAAQGGLSDTKVAGIEEKLKSIDKSDPMKPWSRTIEGGPGFITKDGTFVPVGGGQHESTLREVGFNKKAPLNNYLDSGGIRTYANGPGQNINIEIHKTPTPEQLSVLQKLPDGTRYTYDFYNKGKQISGAGELKSKFLNNLQEVYGKNVAQQTLSDQPKAIKPKVEAKPKTVSVSSEQLPVGEGEKRVSRLEARVKKVLDKVSPETIDKLGLSTYEQMNKKENIQKASKYVTENPDEALEVLRGDKPAPKGILRNSIYVAMQNEALGDVDLARKLASLQSTKYGQELSILTEIDPDSPVSIMTDLVNFRRKAFTAKYKSRSVKTETTKIAKDIKAKIKTPNKYDWKQFIDSIETC